MVTAQSRSAQVHARLDHPVVDADGHHLELGPVFLDYVKRVGGQTMLDRYLDSGMASGELWMREGRRDPKAPRQGWWSFPARNTLDRATACLPRLFYERLDEIGIDYAVVYPTVSRTLAGLPDEEMRIGCCRAYNTYAAEVYREYADRMTAVAVIPVITPEQGVEELEYAVKELGHKAIMISGGLTYPRRPVPGLQGDRSDLAAFGHYVDFMGLDSDYDYDPLWAKCVELKVAVTSHSSGMGWGSRRSAENHIYNHIGHFAAAGEAFCKALFLGGVTRRFPSLKFAFLEGGVAWACSLYGSLVGHWEKRNVNYLEENLDPATIDRELMLQLISEYGDPQITAKLEEFRQIYERELPRPADMDEFSHCRIRRAEEIRDLFVPNFYFGCEADDRTNAWAFNSKINPFGARLRAVFGSDVGHFDVPDMKEVLAEAHELVDNGVMTDEDFRDFMFTNPVSLYAGMNPEFFKGTRIEAAADKLLQRGL